MELEGFQLPYSDKRAMWEEGLRETIRMMSTSPYPGHNGKYFAMPSRNIVPKPIQSPHPPLWLACSSRDTMKLAARLGMGALTFAFTDHREARFWVEEYYDVFRRECVPIGQAVNPNVAVLTGFMLDRDHDKAIELGAPGLRFFAYGLSHYFRTGVHQPAATDLYSLFEQAPIAPMAGLGGIGSPSAVAETFELFEEAGVDQMILLQQAGRYPHSAICDSLELFGREVLPAFVDRHRTRSEAKRRALEPYIERALERVEPFALTTGPVVEAYPLMLERAAASDAALGPTRDIGANALWQLHVGGSATRAGEKD